MTLVQKDYSDLYSRRDPEGEEYRTSDVYKTAGNLPYRFEHPSRWNYGNCVFTPSEAVAKMYPNGADQSSGTAAAHPFFRTTNSQYGSKPPCVHTMPHTYHPRNHKFWEHLASVGMYRNCGFNTGVDKSVI